MRYPCLRLLALFMAFPAFFMSAARADELDVRDAADPERIFLYRLVVSPLRAMQELLHTPSDVSVLDSNELERLPAHDAAEALDGMAGVDVSSRTRFGHFMPLSIRGSESRHVLLMVDGIPFNTQASGQADVLPMLPYESLERIEVIKGSAASAWGSSLGGVIHLLTKTPEHSASMKPRVHTEDSWSEFRGQQHAVVAEGSAGPWDYLVSGEYRESGGSRVKGGTANRDDTLHKKGFSKLIAHVSDSVKTTFSYGYTGADINEGVYPSSAARMEVPYYARYGQVRVEADPDERRHLESAFKFNRQLITSEFLDGASDDLLFGVRTQDHYYGSELKSVSRFREEDTLVAGADLSYHALKSTQLSESRDALFGAPYASYTWVSHPVDLIAGARYDLNEEFGEQFNPSLGAVLHASESPQVLVRLNVSRSLSSPPMLWKFFEGVAPGFTVNNPDLRPERAWTYEAGIEANPVEPLWLKFGVYRSDIRDAVVTVTRPDGFLMKENFDEFRQQGFEFESRVELAEKLFLFFSADFNDVEDRLTGLPVRDRGVTRNGFRLGLEGEAPCGLLFTLVGRYDRWDTDPAAEPNDRKFIFDGKLSKKLVNVRGVDVSGFVGVYNLTNSKYWSDIDFPLPQRTFEGGFTLDF